MISYLQQVVSSFLLSLVVVCGYLSNLMQKYRLGIWEIIEILFPHDKVGRISRPHDVVKWHAEKYGYKVEEHYLTTEDGFILHIERLSRRGMNDDEKRGPPILLQHGLFQSSGIFVVANKHKSLAFYLVDLGYDVWLGNNRGVYDKHVELSTKDHAYWDWSLDELGRYDFSAMVKFVAQHTKQKVLYVGHSQGNAQAFVGLALSPEIAENLDLFVAVAPAYFVNEFKHWSLRLIQKLPDNLFWLIFGSKSFIHIMHPCQHFLHERIFGSFAYTMLSYLFGWTSDKWKKGRKPAIFQTTPRPISTRLIQHWLKVSKTGKLTNHGTTEKAEYPLSRITCPVAVFYGKRDSLVDGEKLVTALKQEGVNVVYDLGVDDYEHMDLIWACDAMETVFQPLVNVFEKVGKNPPVTNSYQTKVKVVV